MLLLLILSLIMFPFLLVSGFPTVAERLNSTTDQRQINDEEETAVSDEETVDDALKLKRRGGDDSRRRGVSNRRTILQQREQGLSHSIVQLITRFDKLQVLVVIAWAMRAAFLFLVEGFPTVAEPLNSTTQPRNRGLPVETLPRPGASSVPRRSSSPSPALPSHSHSK